MEAYMWSHEDERVHLVDWDAHYDKPEGKDLVMARMRVYGCTEKPTNYDQEVINLAHLLKVDEDATFLDIGSSRPEFSEKIHNEGFSGMLIAIDPNSRQFGQRAYWRPLYGDLEVPHANSKDIDLELLYALYEQQGIEDPDHQGIILIEARAERIPLPNNFVDFCTQIFSLYHVTDINEALFEISRLVNQRGYNVMTLSRNRNKAWMHDGQDRIAQKLSEMVKDEVFGPPPLHKGFTVEDAELFVPEFFQNSYIKNIDDTLVFDTKERCDVVLKAHWSQADQFTLRSGRSIDKELFAIALEETVEKDLQHGVKTNNPVTDIASRSVIVSSQSGFEVPDSEYIHIAA